LKKALCSVLEVDELAVEEGVSPELEAPAQAWCDRCFHRRSARDIADAPHHPLTDHCAMQEVQPQQRINRGDPAPLQAAVAWLFADDVGDSAE